jgi:hypothetical protein
MVSYALPLAQRNADHVSVPRPISTFHITGLLKVQVVLTMSFDSILNATLPS